MTWTIKQSLIHQLFQPLGKNVFAFLVTILRSVIYQNRTSRFWASRAIIMSCVCASDFWHLLFVFVLLLIWRFPWQIGVGIIHSLLMEKRPNRNLDIFVKPNSFSKWPLDGHGQRGCKVMWQMSLRDCPTLSQERARIRARARKW